MLRLTFLAALLISLNGCGKKLPLVTLNQLDIKHDVVNPFKITKYNEETCKLELQSQPSYQLSATADGKASPLQGGVCLTPADYTKWKSFLEAECENNKDRQTYEAKLLKKIDTLEAELHVYRTIDTSR